jgi:DNA-directed RNA polymerase subunit RPC12/RpoP
MSTPEHACPECGETLSYVAVPSAPDRRVRAEHCSRCGRTWIRTARLKPTDRSGSRSLESPVVEDETVVPYSRFDPTTHETPS